MDEETITTDRGETLTGRRVLNTTKHYVATADGRMFAVQNGEPAKELRDYHINKYFGVRIDGRTVLKHRILCATFHGPAPAPKMDVAHWNGNPQDNRAENLRWATRDENVRDQLRHGTHWSQRGKRGRHLRWHIEYKTMEKAWRDYQAAHAQKADSNSAGS